LPLGTRPRAHSESTHRVAPPGAWQGTGRAFTGGGGGGGAASAAKKRRECSAANQPSDRVGEGGPRNPHKPRQDVHPDVRSSWKTCPRVRNDRERGCRCVGESTGGSRSAAAAFHPNPGNFSKAPRHPRRGRDSRPRPLDQLADIKVRHARSAAGTEARRARRLRGKQPSRSRSPVGGLAPEKAPQPPSRPPHPCAESY
jgi:hypothetical protein